MPWYLPTRCPILWDELRRRLRGGRHFMLLTGYLAVLIAVMCGAAAMENYDSLDVKEWAEFGRKLWLIMLNIQLISVLLISPGLTAGAIISEHDRGTQDLLYQTPMRTPQLVLGKYLSSLAQMLYVLLAGLPVVSIVFIFGGVSPLEVISGYLLVLIAAGLYASLGLLASTMAKRSMDAHARGYLFMLLVLFSAPVFILLSALGGGMHSRGWAETLLFFGSFTNPFFVEFQFFGMGETENIVGGIIGLIGMMGLSLLVLRWCGIRVSRQRGERMYRYAPVSLTTARYNSRVALEIATSKYAWKKTSEDKPPVKEAESE